MRQSYFPSTDIGLDAWAAVFAPKVAADAVALGVPGPLAAELLASQQALAAAMALASADVTRTRVVVCAKNTAVAAFKAVAREAAELIKSRRGTDPARLVELGLTVPKRARQRIAPPPVAPDVCVAGVSGRTVRLTLRDGQTGRAARPVGVVGAVVLGAIGEEKPRYESQWQLRQTVSRTRCTLVFPPALPAGTRVWIVAQWMTRRAEASPMSAPISTQLGYSIEVPGAAA